MKPHTITISMSNTKMGAIPSFSLMPSMTCPMNAPCAIKGCYMKPLIAMRKSLRESLVKNTSIAMNNPEEIFNQVCGWLAMYRPVAFRIHVAGDFFNADYLAVWNRIARKNPSVKFFAFTKQFDVLRNYIANIKLARNLSIILSAWLPDTEGWLPPDDLRKKFPVAWVVDKECKSLSFIAGIGKNVDYCYGNCESCGKCFSRKRKDGDIAFTKH